MPIDIEVYYQRYGPMVLRRCRGLLGDEELAVDAMHDTFVQLLRRQDKLEVATPGGLLYRIATNVCLNRIRSLGRRREAPGGDELLGRIAAQEEPERDAIARNLLTRLFDREKPSTRTIAVLHLLDGLTLEEVAREVGMSVSGVRARLRPLRARLAAIEGSSK